MPERLDYAEPPSDPERGPWFGVFAAALSAFALAVALGLLWLQVGGDRDRVALALVVGLLWFVFPFMASFIVWASADELRPMLGPPLTRLLLANAVAAPALHLVAVAWACVFLITR